MITEGDATNPLEKSLHAFRDQEITKQSSTIANSSDSSVLKFKNTNVLVLILYST